MPTKYPQSNVPLPIKKAVQISITKEAIALLDKEAFKRGMSRSGLIEHFARYGKLPD